MATLIINAGSKEFSKEPAFRGVTESIEKIWSSNTGRVSTGKMTGDLVAIKKKLVIKYPPLTDTERQKLENAVADAFFSVTYKGRKYTMYADSPVLNLYSMAAGLPRYEGASLTLVEQ